MVFDHPLLLAVAVVLPLALAALVIAAYRRRRARLARLGSIDIVSRLVPQSALRAPRWRAVVLALAALLAGVAVAGPRWGVEQTVIRGEGIDLVLALDASLSMMAADVEPNRLTRMKQEVRRLRALSSGDRVGLIAFAGRSYILTPLTLDDAALDLYLDNLDPSVVGQAGSSLSRTIRQGVALLLATNTGSDRALVVMSDGEAFEPEEDVRAAARLAAEKGIMLVTVGFGTTEGGRIPIREGRGRTPTFKRDDQGNIVVTRYSPELLRAAAEEAEGVFIAADATDKAGRVRRALSGLRTQQRATAAGSERRLRYQLFLLPALLLLLVDTALAERRGRRRREPAAATTALPRGAAAAMLALSLSSALACGGPAAEAARAYRAKQYPRAVALFREAVSPNDPRPEMIYNLGTALLAADSLAAAAEALERTTRATEPELRYRSLFNLGLAHLVQGRRAEGDAATAPLDAALATYKTVLLMRSGDGDAKWNYELALREKENSGGGGGGGGDEDEPSPAPQTADRGPPTPQPSGDLGRQRAEQLLNSAAREEREVQAREQRESSPQPPPTGKDW